MTLKTSASKTNGGAIVASNGPKNADIKRATDDHHLLITARYDTAIVSSGADSKNAKWGGKVIAGTKSGNINLALIPWQKMIVPDPIDGGEMVIDVNVLILRNTEATKDHRESLKNGTAVIAKDSEIDQLKAQLAAMQKTLEELVK